VEKTNAETTDVRRDADVWRRDGKKKRENKAERKPVTIRKRGERTSKGKRGETSKVTAAYVNTMQNYREVQKKEKKS